MLRRCMFVIPCYILKWNWSLKYFIVIVFARSLHATLFPFREVVKQNKYREIFKKIILKYYWQAVQVALTWAVTVDQPSQGRWWGCSSEEEAGNMFILHMG